MNMLPGSTESRILFNQLSNYELLSKGSVPWGSIAG